MTDGPGTTSRRLLPLPRRHPTRDRRCLGQPLGMRLAGANWLSSRFTFVFWSIPDGEAPRQDRVAGRSVGGGARYNTPGGSPPEAPIMNDCNETVNVSTTGPGSPGPPCDSFFQSSARKASALTGKFACRQKNRCPANQPFRAREHCANSWAAPSGTSGRLGRPRVP
jgi:hypothetical protein